MVLLFDFFQEKTYTLIIFLQGGTLMIKIIFLVGAGAFLSVHVVWWAGPVWVIGCLFLMGYIMGIIRGVFDPVNTRQTGIMRDLKDSEKKEEKD
jgi:hypothetical protein